MRSYYIMRDEDKNSANDYIGNVKEVIEDSNNEMTKDSDEAEENFNNAKYNLENMKENKGDDIDNIKNNNNSVDNIQHVISVVI